MRDGMEMMLLQLVLLLSLMQMGQVKGSAFQAFCQDGQNRETPLRFTDKPLGNYEITCDGAYVELHCCVQGYSSITWLKRGIGTWKELTYDHLIYLQSNDNNQTLTFQSPYKKSAENDYMCVAEDGGGNIINNTIWLEIAECNGQNQAPKAILPDKDFTMRRPLGSEAIIKCVGFFGIKHEDTLSDIYWRNEYINGTGHKIEKFWVPKNNVLPPTAPNIKLTYDASEAHIISTVRITNITQEDYARYICQMTNTINTTFRAITLVEGNETITREIAYDYKEFGWQMAVIGLALILGLLFVLTPLIHFFLLDIKLFYRDRISKVLKDGKVYDALIVYNCWEEKDRKFVTCNMINILEAEFGYKFFVEDREALGGEAEASDWLKRANDSRCIIFLMTPALLRRQWADFLFLSTAERTDTKRIFLIYQKVEDKHWQNYQETFKTAFKVAKRKVIWPAKQSSSEAPTHNHNSSTHNQSSSTPNQISLTHNQSSSTPNQISLTHNQSSSTPNQISLTHNQSSSTPNQISLTHNQSSSTHNQISLTHNKSSSTWCDNMPRREQKFWKQMRLALPKPLSLCETPSNRQSNSIPLSNDYNSQSSTSSQTPLAGLTPSGPPYAFEVI